MNKNDLNRICCSKQEYLFLKKCTVLVTGATGLIGSGLIEVLLYLDLDIRIIAHVRSKEKAYSKFGDRVTYYVGDIKDTICVNEDIDYIVHCANPTASSFFVEKPVETIETAVGGAFSLLKLAVKKKPKKVIFLSTMEVHGTPNSCEKIHVEDGGTFDTQNIRNCYPLSKQLCENLFLSYFKEYGVNSCVVRLTQTFGPGISYSDKRVFAEFARCVIEKKNIELKTKGKTERSYLYISDAIKAILVVLKNGVCGNVYTAANEDTYCSIYDMALLVAKKGEVKVVIKEEDISKYGFADELHMNLDTSKLRQIGWKPEIGLNEAFDSLIEYMTEIKS